MGESFKLASTTVNLDVFCMRYKLALQKAYTLLQAEQVGVRGVKKLNYHSACITVINSAEALKTRVLYDFTQEATSKAEELKTRSGKCNRYVKILETLEEAGPTFALMKEYDDTITDIKERINALGRN